MDPNNSDTNAPDSWDSLDDPGPGETNDDTSDLNARLLSLNVNAKPFIPNVNAPAFVPSFLKTAESNGKNFFSCLMFVLSTSLWWIVLKIWRWFVNFVLDFNIVTIMNHVHVNLGLLLVHLEYQIYGYIMKPPPSCLWNQPYTWSVDTECKRYKILVKDMFFLYPCSFYILLWPLVC